MNILPQAAPGPNSPNPDRATTLALRLAHAENALLSLTSGQVDAIIDPQGRPYLLRPAQEHLQKCARRLQAVLDASADVILVVNRAGTILSQNRAVQRVLGYEPEELLGTSIFQRVHDDHLQGLYTAFFNVAEGLEPHAVRRFLHLSSTGPDRAVEATLGRMEDGLTTQVVVTLRPATALLPFPAPRPQKIRAPIASPGIPKPPSPSGPRSPFVEALLSIATLEDGQWGASSRLAIEMVWRRHELEARLREQPVDFGAEGDPNVRLRLEPIDAHEAAQSAVELCQAECEAASVEVLLYLRAEEKTVRADWARLLQVLCTLIKNAVDVSLPGGAISISSRNEEGTGRLILELADQGLGIEPAVLPRVFDVCPPGGLSLSAPGGGSRISLNVAQRLARTQGGTLTASSLGCGRGATFHLAFRAVSARKSAPVIVLPEEARPPFQPLSILLVADPPDAGLVTLLTECGHATISAADLRTGLILVENCRFDIFISSLDLPDRSGYELMECLRLTRPTLAGIALSSDATPTATAEAQAAGFSHHLAKPVTLEALQSILQAIARTR